MRVVIAPDSFKECLSAAGVAAAMAVGVRRAAPSAELALVPMADGGEGTVDALVATADGEKVRLRVSDPLGGAIEAEYGLIDNGATAVMEMASASGLGLVPADRRDPRITSTRGTGELIRDALDRGVRRIILGIGGSATNDGGAGMASALGFRLLDSEGEDLPHGGATLARLAHIDARGRHPRLDGCEILVACDVTNPLCGDTGASYVFGPQKGAGPEAVRELDAALRHFGEIVEQEFGVAVLELPGGGAAGGLGAGLAALLGAKLSPGVELVAQACDLDGRVRSADLVLTGEGALDGQTAGGKTPLGVARVAKKHGVPVIAIAGVLRPGHEALFALGIDAAFSICTGPMTLAEAMTRAEELIAQTTEAVMRCCAATRRNRAL